MNRACGCVDVGRGIALAVFLSLLRLPEVVEQLIMLALSLSLMVAGSVWALRWLSGQRVKFWPAIQNFCCAGRRRGQCCGPAYGARSARFWRSYSRRLQC